jgi:hypothetical protein
MTLAENVLGKFEKWVLMPLKEDIENQGRNHFNGFILLSVVIDNLASMRYRSQYPDSVRGNIGLRYRKFIENYFPAKYKKHSGNLYRGYRCKLVHAFQIGGFDVQQGEGARKYHLRKLKSGALCLHSHELMKDVLQAYEKFKSEVLGASQKPEVVAAFKRGNYHGWAHAEV